MSSFVQLQWNTLKKPLSDLIIRCMNVCWLTLITLNFLYACFMIYSNEEDFKIIAQSSWNISMCILSRSCFFHYSDLLHEVATVQVHMLWTQWSSLLESQSVWWQLLVSVQRSLTTSPEVGSDWSMDWSINNVFELLID